MLLRIFAASLVLLSSGLSATTIVETSDTLEFYGAVVNSAGQVAYFARPINPSSSEFDLPSIHRDGAQWVSANGAYEEIDDDTLVITDLGVVMFGAFQGDFSLTFPNGTTAINSVGGVYRGPSPQTPIPNDPYIEADTVFAQRGTSGSTPVAYSSGDLIFDRGSLTARAPFAPCNNSDQIVANITNFSGSLSGRPGALSAANNNRFVASVVTAFDNGQADGIQLTLGRYFDFCPGDPGSDTFADLADSTERYFSNVSDISLDEDNVITVIASRQIAGVPVQGVYRISSSGAITAIRETDDNDPTGWQPIALSRSGSYLFSQLGATGRSELFFSKNPDQAVIGDGHVLDGMEISCRVGVGGVSDGGQVACVGQICPVDDEENCQNAVILASSGTDFPPDPNDPPEEVVFWGAPVSGSFATASNWDPNTVPDSDQLAVFDASGSYTVDLGSSAASTKGLRIEGGTVSFDGGSYQLNTGSFLTPSLQVTPVAGNLAPGLILQSNHQLQTTHARIGGEIGGGLPFVFVDGASAAWDNAGLISVDGWLSLRSGSLASDSVFVGDLVDSNGLFTVGSTECVACIFGDPGELWVGYSGTGAMELTHQAVLSATQLRVIGGTTGSSGTVLIDSGVWSTPFEDSGDLIVADAGQGTLTIENNGAVQAQNILLGRVAGSMGNVTVSGELEALADLQIGLSGTGTMMVTDGDVAADSVTLGLLSGSSGTVSLSDSALSVNGPVLVGAGGSGSLTLLSGTTLLPLDALNAFPDLFIAAAGSQANGSMIVDDSAVTVNNLLVGAEDNGSATSTGQLIVRNGAMLTATALTVATGSQLATNNATVMAPTTTPSPKTGRAKGASTLVVTNRGEWSSGDTPGSFVIEGDLIHEGVWRVLVTGQEAGQATTVQVQGNADFNEGIVQLVFEDYLPQTGDRIRMLSVAGNLQISPSVQFQVEGILPDFQFDLDQSVAGEFAIVALTDARTEEIFSNGFE